MPELGKMEEGRAKDMDSQLRRKAETGLGSDRLPWEPRELTFAEIRISVTEARRGHSTC